MGYTHYWDHPAHSSQDWSAFVADVKRIFAYAKASNIPLAAGSGSLNTKPIANAGVVAFNGVAPEDYESFVLQPQPTEFDFCKTAYRPYDEVVCAVLWRAKTVLPGFNLRSDGAFDSDAWKAGIALLDEALASKGTSR
jgi:hypothetical protein